MRRPLTVLLVCALLAPRPAVAAPTGLEEAKALHQQAQARFDTADYRGAVEAWTKAYEALPSDARGVQMRPFILYNIATARERAYEVDRDVAQLRQARILLERFEASISEIYVDAEEAAVERERVQARLRALEEKIRTHEGENPPASLEPEPEAEPEPEPEPEPELEPEPEPEPASEPAPETPDPSERSPLVVTGGVLTGLGVVLGGMAVVGLVVGSGANEIGPDVEDDYVARGDQFQRGRTGNVLAIVGGVGAPLALAAGVALIVVGKKRGRATALLPQAGPRSAGLLVRGRF